MTTLVIIESPGKKKKLEEILGPDYVIRASYGHIRDLPERELGVAAPTYRPAYVVSGDRAESTVAALRKAAAGADRVLLATDPDREGEAIAWHVAEVLRLRNPERITYSEITRKAVQAAVASPRPLDMSLVHAQEARRVLDRLVGYKVSPALSNSTGQSLSAGRVQSPAVRLVVDRERAIRAFSATKHFGAVLHFDTPTPWRATWSPVLPEGAAYQLDAALAQQAADVTALTVTAFEDGHSASPPPAPFTTSTLQQAAQARLKFKPKTTMELAQRLYEQGAITYMRTDSPNLSDDACSQIAAYADANNLPLAPARRTWKAKGNAQEAHEAIRPSHIDAGDAGETTQERALYRLIWSRAVASQLADATFAVRTATLESIEPVGGAPAIYQARGRTLTSKGWKALYDEPESEDPAEDEDGSDSPVPALAVGDTLHPGRGELKAKTTRPPKRYTLATLVKELEAHGIGRPATYAAILDNITRRQYIAEDSKGFLSATPTAELIVDALINACGFIGLEYTRDLEHELDRIAEGQRSYVAVVSAADAQLTAEIGAIAPLAAHTHPCPECGGALRRRTGSRGPFWGCANYPTCKVTLPDVGGAPGERRAPVTETPSSSTHACPDCSAPLRRKTLPAKADPKGKGYDFWGCSGFPKCKRTFRVDPAGNPVLVHD